MDNRYWYGLDRYVHPMGMGCWQLAGQHYINGVAHGWGEVDEDDAIRLVHTALDYGIEFFDTAIGYGNGKSEALLGKAFSLSAAGKDAIVCTKIPLTDTEIENSALADDFSEKINQSLKRLQKDQIDILLFHNPPDNTDWKNFDVSVLHDLQKAGKIKTYGVSSRSISGAESVIQSEFGTCLEWVFNIFERRPVDRFFSKLNSSKINFIARSPLSRGFVSGRYLNENPNFDDTDFRSTLPKEWINWVIDSLRKIEVPATEVENVTNYALQYCLSFNEVSAVIPGIKSVKQLDAYLIKHDEKFYNQFFNDVNNKTEASYPKW